jgi:hypothetical protein
MQAAIAGLPEQAAKGTMEKLKNLNLLFARAKAHN